MQVASRNLSLLLSVKKKGGFETRTKKWWGLAFLWCNQLTPFLNSFTFRYVSVVRFSHKINSEEGSSHSEHTSIHIFIIYWRICMATIRRNSADCSEDDTWPTVWLPQHPGGIGHCPEVSTRSQKWNKSFTWGTLSLGNVKIRRVLLSVTKFFCERRKRISVLETHHPFSSLVKAK